jgi:hypothetical protein
MTVKSMFEVYRWSYFDLGLVLSYPYGAVNSPLGTEEDFFTTL